jgi:hypothetical protein
MGNKELVSVSKEVFLANLKSGDIGLICAHNFFATLQNWFRKRFDEGPQLASHGFYVIDPPKIVESNGLFITGPGHDDPTIIKNIGDSTQCWVFRYLDLTIAQLESMNDSAEMAVDVGGHYSIGGILQFAKSFFTKKRNEPDESGVFCTEFTSDLVIHAGIPFLKKVPWQIDPTTQLTWLKTEGYNFHWQLVNYYNGQGQYFISIP